MSGVEKLYDPLFRELQAHISETRKDNEARHLYWEHLSSNNWGNEAMEILADDAFDFLRLELNSFDSRASTQDVIEAISKQWVEMDLADFVINDRELSSKIPSHLITAGKALARDFARAKNAIDDLRYEEEQADRGGRNSRDSRDAPRGGRNARNDRDDGRTSTRERERDGGRTGRGRGDREEREERGGSTRGGMGSLAARRAREPEPEREEVEERGPRVARTSRGSRTVEVRPSKPAKLDGPDFTLANPYDLFFEAGEEWRPAHKSGWSVSWSKDGQFETTYDIHKKIRFHVKGVDGVVREEFLDMQPEMSKLLTEVEGKQPRDLTREQRAKFRTAAGEGNLPPAPATFGADNESVIRVAESKIEPMSDSIQTADSRDEAEMVIELHRLEAGVDAAMIDYVRLVPLATDLRKFAALEELSDAINLTDAAEKLNAAYADSDPALWNFLNDRFTLAVNHATKHVYGLKLPIDDFAQDYTDLLGVISKRRGEAFARDFSQATRHLVQAVTSRLAEAEVMKYMTQRSSLTEEEFNNKRPPVVVYEDHFSAVTVPFKSTELGIDLSSESQKVDSEEQPFLHRFLQKFIKQASDKSDFARCYVITADRIRMEVMVSGLDAQTYLVRQMVD